MAFPSNSIVEWLDVGTLRNLFADPNPPNAEKTAMLLAQAQAAGASSDTLSYLSGQLEGLGGAAGMESPGLFVSEALEMLADREKSQALNVWRWFALWLLMDPFEGVLCGTPSSQAAVEQAVELLMSELGGEPVEEMEWWNCAVQGFDAAGRGRRSWARHSARTAAYVAMAFHDPAQARDAADRAVGAGGLGASRRGNKVFAIAERRQAEKLIELLTRRPGSYLPLADKERARRLAQELGEPWPEEFG